MISNSRQSLVKGERLVRNDMRPVLMNGSAFATDTPVRKRCVDFTMDTRCGEKFGCDIVVDVTQRVGHTRRECNAEATSETGHGQAT